MRSSTLLKLATLLVAGLFAFQVMAQTVVTGDISGTVTDQSNAVVIGATVTLSSPEIGYSQSTKTTSTGLYRFSLLKPANYKLSVAQSGFRTSEQPVTVAIGASHDREYSTASRPRLRDRRGKWCSSIDPDGKCEPPNHYECASD